MSDQIIHPDDELECPDCDGEVDENGDTLQSDAGCVMPGWIHESDCQTCGAVYCDSSC